MKRWVAILLIILTAVVCFMAGYGCRSMRPSKPMPGDTVIVRDTLRDSIPYPVVETVIQEIPELVPFYVTLAAGRIVIGYGSAATVLLLIAFGYILNVSI